MTLEQLPRTTDPIKIALFARILEQEAPGYSRRGQRCRAAAKARYVFCSGVHIPVH
jgi:hypothetical protein